MPFNLSFMEHPAVKQGLQIMETEFAKKRDDGILSLAHDERHVTNVAKCAGVIAQALMDNFIMPTSDDRKFIPIAAAFAGSLHDIKRTVKEKGQKHAIEAAIYMEAHNHVFGDNIMREAFEWAKLAAGMHEFSIGDIRGIFGNSSFPTPLEIVVIAHKLADGAIEASGYRVVERRCFFVGRERILHGDLKDHFTDYPMTRRSVFAVIGESLVRLYKSLPIADYPQWFIDYSQRLHGKQYIFLQGLLPYAGFIDEIHAAEFMIELHDFPKFEGILEKVQKENHLSGNFFKKDEFPILYDAIEEARSLDQEKLAEASSLVVKIISEAETPEIGIKNLQKLASESDNEIFIDFAQGIVAAGNCDEKFLKEVYDAVVAGVEKVKAV